MRMSAVFGTHAVRAVARWRRRPRVSSWRLQGPKSMTHPMPSPQRWLSSAISNPCSAASFTSRSCARLDPRSVTSFVPNLCLATLTSCSSAPSWASPRSSIDPADSRSRTPFGRLWTMLPRLVRVPRDGRARTCLSPLLMTKPPDLRASRRIARWSPCPARAAKNSFQDPGCVATPRVRHPLIVVLSLRSAG